MPRTPKDTARTDFGQRMFDSRMAAKLTQKQVCAKLGDLAQSTLSEAETTSNSSTRTVEFAALYKVNARWLSTGKGKPTDPAAQVGYATSLGPTVKFGTPSAGHTPPPDDIVLSLLAVKASMGYGAHLPDDNDNVISTTVSAAWLRRAASFSAPQNLALLTGEGDSMKGTYEDGDILLIDRSVDRIRPDGVYVLLFGDNLYVKRIQTFPDGTVRMISDNKERYDPFVIKAEQRDSLQVLGRVVMVWNARRL